VTYKGVKNTRPKILTEMRRVSRQTSDRGLFCIKPVDFMRQAFHEVVITSALFLLSREKPSYPLPFTILNISKVVAFSKSPELDCNDGEHLFESKVLS
jgi:hypothetical protein